MLMTMLRREERRQKQEALKPVDRASSVVWRKDGRPAMAVVSSRLVSFSSRLVSPNVSRSLPKRLQSPTSMYSHLAQSRAPRPVEMQSAGNP
jgi:hypothetical protein